MKKKIIKWTIVAIIVASVILNAYWLGWRKIEQRIFNVGMNTAIDAVINQVQQTGQVIISTPDKQIILIPK